jgi:hypothetical protein
MSPPPSGSTTFVPPLARKLDRLRLPEGVARDLRIGEEPVRVLPADAVLSLR